MTKIQGGGSSDAARGVEQSDRGNAASANHADRERFRKEIGRKDEQERERRNDANDQAAQNPGNALLRGMQKQKSAAGPAEGAGKSVGDVAKTIADRILVGEKNAAGNKEVRIHLKDSVLGGSEIRVTELHGKLQITIVAGTVDAQNFMNAKQGDLKSELNSRLNREVEVTVTDRDGDAQHQSDQRSRNRRSVLDETED